MERVCKAVADWQTANQGQEPSTTDVWRIVGGNKGDGYGYDIAINPGKNLMLTSSFAGWNNYMMDLGKLMQDQSAMKNFGARVVVTQMYPTPTFLGAVHAEITSITSGTGVSACNSSPGACTLRIRPWSSASCAPNTRPV